MNWRIRLELLMTGITLSGGRMEKSFNTCSKDDGYLMAPFTIGNNRGHFSNCSVQQIREFVKNLGDECKEVKSKRKPYDANATVLPGTNMNPNDYCNLKHPNFCNITAKEDKINQCQFDCCPGGRVKCYYNEKERNDSCSLKRDINMGLVCPFKCCSPKTFKCFTEIALDGMSCGDGMMCFRGKCIPRCDPFKKTLSSRSPPAENESIKVP
uniref:Putative metalloprotease n=1 Tax=Ixodes ricinus TaxID=34613 RepID=A0A0K8RHV2_IXORI